MTHNLEKGKEKGGSVPTLKKREQKKLTKEIKPRPPLGGQKNPTSSAEGQKRTQKRPIKKTHQGGKKINHWEQTGIKLYLGVQWAKRKVAKASNPLIREETREYKPEPQKSFLQKRRVMALQVKRGGCLSLGRAGSTNRHRLY